MKRYRPDYSRFISQLDWYDSGGKSQNLRPMQYTRLGELRAVPGITKPRLMKPL